MSEPTAGADADPAAQSAPASGQSSVAPGLVTGLFRSLTNLLATFIAIIQTRLELLTTELQEEVQRAVSLALWAMIALFLLIIGLFFGGITIVLVYWDTHRVLAALLVAGAFFFFAVIATLVLLAKIKSRPRLLSATLAELAKDREQLRSRT